MSVKACRLMESSDRGDSADGLDRPFDASGPGEDLVGVPPDLRILGGELPGRLDRGAGPVAPAQAIEDQGERFVALGVLPQRQVGLGAGHAVSRSRPARTQARA